MEIGVINFNVFSGVTSLNITKDLTTNSVFVSIFISITL